MNVQKQTWKKSQTNRWSHQPRPRGERTLWKASIPLRAACRGPSVMWAIRSAVQLPERLNVQRNAHSLPQWPAGESRHSFRFPHKLPAVIQHWHFSTNQYLIIGSNRARSNPPEIAGAQSAQMSLCLCVRTRIISSAAIIERAFTCQIVY